MASIRKILAATDFSEGSKATLRYGLLLAESCNARLDVLHVCWEPPSYLGIQVVMMEMPADATEPAESYIRRKAEGEMAVFLASVEGADAVRKTLYKRGDAAQAILSTALEQQSDLLVLGTHGRSGVDRLILGSVAEKVLRRAPCPILTVRAPD